MLTLVFGVALFAEDAVPKPESPEPAPSNALDREWRTLAILDFRDIRFSAVGGSITFRVGDLTYVWFPDRGSEASLIGAGAALLAELRLAQKVAIRGWLYNDEKRYHIRDFDLLYDSLK